MRETKSQNEKNIKNSDNEIFTENDSINANDEDSSTLDTIISEYDQNQIPP